ncbi:hypothetical protein GCM10023075_40830 [Streptosporangium album]
MPVGMVRPEAVTAAKKMTGPVCPMAQDEVSVVAVVSGAIRRSDRAAVPVAPAGTVEFAAVPSAADVDAAALAMCGIATMPPVATVAMSPPTSQERAICRDTM